MEATILSIKIFLLLALAISGVKSDIRCHCNQPVCVRTGYMCKSKGPQAGCFVEHSSTAADIMDRSGGGGDISRHGCIEMLPVEQRTQCLAAGGRNPSTIHHNHHNHQRFHHLQQQRRNKTITCCSDDMCNYVKTIQVNDDDADSIQISPEPPSVPSHHQHHHSHNHHHHHRPINSESEFDSSSSNLLNNSEFDDSLSQDWSMAFIISCTLILFICLFGVIFCVVQCIKARDLRNHQPLGAKKNGFPNPNQTGWFIGGVPGQACSGKKSPPMKTVITPDPSLTVLTIDEDQLSSYRNNFPIDILSGLPPKPCHNVAYDGESVHEQQLQTTFDSKPISPPRVDLIPNPKSIV